MRLKAPKRVRSFAEFSARVFHADGYILNDLAITMTTRNQVSLPLFLAVCFPLRVDSN